MTVALEVGAPELTPRECEVAEMIARDLTNAEIGRRLFISRTTVASHIGKMVEKLGVRSRVGIAAWWVTRRERAAAQTSLTWGGRE